MFVCMGACVYVCACKHLDLSGQDFALYKYFNYFIINIISIAAGCSLTLSHIPLHTHSLSLSHTHTHIHTHTHTHTHTL